MPINDDIGYDLDAECDGIAQQARAMDQQLQAVQDEHEQDAGGGDVSTRILASTEQLQQLLRRIRKLARMVKHLKRAVEGDSIDDTLDG